MYKLSPSDFAYLYEECKLCYYLKVRHGITRPQMPMPGVFSAINTRIQGNLVGKELQSLSKSLPNGFVECQEGWVESKRVPDTNVFIKGKYDLLVKLEDGSHLLVDLKISQPDIGKIDKYATQLNAYKFALENPINGIPAKISRLGLLIFYPDKVEFDDGGAELEFPAKWLEVPIDDAGFLNFAKKIYTLLAGPTPPESESCKWCEYRHIGEGWTHPTPPKDEIPF